MNYTLSAVVIAGLLYHGLGSVSAQESNPDPEVLTVAQAEAIKAQIKRLNAPDYIAREDAERELLKIGQPALSLLQEAAKAPDPEVAARANRLVAALFGMATKPVKTYSDVLPETSILFLEAPDTRKTLDKFKTSPLGKFWDLPSIQKFVKGHRNAEGPNEQKMLDALTQIPKLLDGKALFALGPPETIDIVDLDPPLLYVLETKQALALESNARAVFQGMSDAPRSSRRYGPFTIDEHMTAQTVFGHEGIIHALTQIGIESFLGNLLERPEQTLSPVLASIRALLPGYDVELHLATDAFKQLSEAGTLVDDEQLKTLDVLGILAGSTWQSVFSVNPDGIEEFSLLSLAEGKKNEGLAGVLKAMGQNLSVATPATASQALDLIPWQSGILISFNGDVAKNAGALTLALKSFDARFSPQDNQAEKAINAAPSLPTPRVAGRENLADGAEKPEGGAAPKSGAEKAAAEDKEPCHLRVSQFEKTGLKLEQFLEQIDGSVQLAIFPQQVEGTVPDAVPLSPLFAVVLKNPKMIEQALDAAAADPKPVFTKEVLNGGIHYISTLGDEDVKPGFWLKDNYLAYSTERVLLDLAGMALAHRAGNERIADRESFKRMRGNKKMYPNALLTIFGDSDQVLEMPYGLARANWQEDEKNPWPDYALIKPLLQNNSIFVQFKAVENGFEIYAQTPLSLIGMIEAFRRPLLEAFFF